MRPHAPALPIDHVSWTNATAMAARLDATGAIRLPTEAQWEYDCRAGGANLDACGDPPTEAVAQSSLNLPRAQPVGGKRANAWGLHDMSGNVWDLVQDCWHPNYRNAAGDGSAWVDEGDCGHAPEQLALGVFTHL